MQTNFSLAQLADPEIREADKILRTCVHCGFCTATCPTYVLLGDELDGPRGRIYLIKQVLEGKEPTAATQLHLDRCLTCRNCETTCPSGVQYGRLVDIGREVVEQRVPRSVGDRIARSALKEGLTSSAFAPALKLGQLVRPLLPATLRSKVPERQRTEAWPRRQHARKMLLLALDGVTSFSAVPLRIISMLGGVVCLLSILLTFWVLWVRLFTNRAVPGWASSVLPMYFLGSV